LARQQREVADGADVYRIGLGEGEDILDTFVDRTHASDVPNSGNPIENARNGMEDKKKKEYQPTGVFEFFNGP
jgi:hypothetical protein